MLVALEPSSCVKEEKLVLGAAALSIYGTVYLSLSQFASQMSSGNGIFFIICDIVDSGWI